MHTEADAGGLESRSDEEILMTAQEINEFSVDSYIDHAGLEEIINDRLECGWSVWRFIECRPKDDREYCTIIWRK